MKLSVLIPVGGILDTDPWRKRSLNWLLQRYNKYGRALAEEVEVCWGTSYQEPYNRSEARNNAFGQATGDILLIADADTVFHITQIQAGIKLIEEGAPWVIPYGLGRYYNLSQQATAAILDSPRGFIPEPTDPDDWEFKLDSWAGLLLVSREAWLTVGGYDEEFIGWGFEDVAFRTALDLRVGPNQRTEDYVLHLWHPVTEDTRFAQPYAKVNQARYLRYQSGELP